MAAGQPAAGSGDRLGARSLFGLLAAANVVAILMLLAVRFPARQIEPEITEQLPQGDGLVPAMN